VDDFFLGDQTTGSGIFTNSPTIDVEIHATASQGEVLTGFAITESPEPPWEWLPMPPETCTIAGPQGEVTLFAWVMDSAGAIAMAPASIHYSTAKPKVLGAMAMPEQAGVVLVMWETDIPAEGSVKFRPVGQGGPYSVAWEAAAMELFHSAWLAPLDPALNHQIILVNNEVQSTPFYWPEPWPIPCDTNMDCRVNVLDLIFVRNRLNQPVDWALWPSSGNWQADANGDGRVNVLDLISVRNNLSTQCP